MKLMTLLLISLLLATGVEAAGDKKKCSKCSKDEKKVKKAEKKLKKAETKFKKCVEEKCPSPSPSPPMAPPLGTFTDKDSLKVAVELFYVKPGKAEKEFGKIADWDVSGITDMDELFLNMANFNADISSWDTSGVTSMLQMFKGAKSFNQPVSSFDTSKVTNMNGVFQFTSAFNQLVTFDTSSVTDFSFMFYEATAFDQSLSFDTSSAVGMNFMFSFASSLSDANKLLIRCAWADTDAFDPTDPDFDTEGWEDLGTCAA